MKKIMYLAFALLVIVSCKKKSEDTNTTTPSKDQLAGTYKITGESVNGQDYWSIIPACQKDDTFKLNADNTYVDTDAGTTCSSNPTPQTGTWSISGSTLTLDTQPMTVQSFTGTTLVLKETTTVNGQTYTTVTTYSKQ